MNTVDEAIQILHAIKNGNAVQYHNDTGWVERIGKTVPAFTLYKYRVKPEPREIYVDLNGRLPEGAVFRYVDEDCLEANRHSLPTPGKVRIKFREVVE